jgi:hypothetical protein
MKLKPKLNVDAVKRALIQHGEKAAFGLAVLMLLVFFWKTVGLEVLGSDRKPDPLKKLAEEAKQHILTSVWDPKAKNIEIVDYPARAEHVPLNDRDYHLAVELDKPLWEMHGKRPAPKLLPVEELVATAGQGILALKAEKGTSSEPSADTRPVRGSSSAKPAGAKISTGATPKGFYFVAITGLVPLRKQSAEFDDAFRTALDYNPSTDAPAYEGMKIERAVVTGSEPNEMAWEELDLAAVGEFVDKWAGMDKNSSEVVDEQYVDPLLTMPLAPMLGKDWDPAVAGHPKIPLIARLDSSKKPEKEAAPVKEQERAWGPKSSARAGATAEKTPTPSPATDKTAPTKVDRELFRFVDYTVEPGKQYCYRVKLALRNPNYQKSQRFLKDAKDSQAAVLEAAWSQPTPIVAVSRGVNILAGPILKPAEKALHDPDVEICVVVFAPDRGGEAAGKKLVQRGVLANFVIDPLWVLSPDHQNLNNWKKVDLTSNALVVDVQGGRKLSKKDALIEPVELLVLDAEGRLVVRDELDDADEYHTRLDPLTSSGSSEPRTEAAPKDDNPYRDLPPTKAGGKKRPPASTKAGKAAVKN